MQEQKRTVKMPHIVTIDDRRQMKLSGVKQVDSFDEQVVTLSTEQGRLTIKGENLKINGLDVETGDCSITGNIYGMAYSDEKSGGTLRRLFR